MGFFLFHGFESRPLRHSFSFRSPLSGSRSRALLALAALASLVPSWGCVERRLLLQSEPAGALVLVDNEPRGKTPVEIPFSYYGARDIVLEKEGFVTLHTVIEVDEPLWQLFPADFVTDVLVPATIEDVHEFSFVLVPEPERDFGPADAAPAIERARDLRGRARETEAGDAPEASAEPAGGGDGIRSGGG